MEHFKILGLKPGATKEEIKSAYRKKAAKLHPDKGGSAEEFDLLHKSYELALDQSSTRVNIPIRGRVIAVQVTVPLEKLIHGTTHSISFQDRIIEVNLPNWQPSWGNQRKFIINEHNIELTVNANEQKFYFAGHNLATDIVINNIEAMVGCIKQINNQTISIPAGVQYDDCIRIPNHGFIVDSTRQDLFCYVKISTIIGSDADLDLTIKQLLEKYK